jgi:hypothetical protein
MTAMATTTAIATSHFLSQSRALSKPCYVGQLPPPPGPTHTNTPLLAFSAVKCVRQLHCTRPAGVLDTPPLPVPAPTSAGSWCSRLCPPAAPGVPISDAGQASPPPAPASAPTPTSAGSWCSGLCAPASLCVAISSARRMRGRPTASDVCRSTMSSACSWAGKVASVSCCSVQLY